MCCNFFNSSFTTTNDHLLLVVVDEAAGAGDGLIDLTASGGTPCYVGSPLVITEYDPEP